MQNNANSRLGSKITTAATTIEYKIKTFPGPKINFCFRWRADFSAAFLAALLMLRHQHRQPTTVRNFCFN